MSEKRTSKRTASKKAAVVSSKEESTTNTQRISKKRQNTSKKDHKVSDEKEEAMQEVSDLEEENEHQSSDQKDDEQKVNETEDSDANDNSKRKRAGNAQKKSGSEPPTKVTKQEGKLNKTESDFDLLDFSSKSETKDGKAWNLKISSWNVSGLRALIKKSGLDFLKHEDPDVFVMQETKCSTNKLPPEAIVEGYHKYWCAADKEGYSGTSLFSKVKPLNVTYGIGIKEHDTEGRIITAEYDKFYLVNAYVPNAGRGLVTLPKRMKWDIALREYLKKLDAKKPVILCGDLNVAHNEIDLANPKTNTKSAGFTKEERDGMTALLEEGFVDSFRHLYSDKSGAYTFWTYFGNARTKNVGWRLDYFILSKKLLDNLCDNIIRSDVYGSDHCPITLLINI